MKAKERYEALTKNREQFLQRARHNAMLTIPSLMPLAGHDGKAHLIEPYQSLGAEGATSLSSRITLALIPAGRPHLRLDIPPLQLMEMGGEVPVEVQQNLAKGEKLIQAAVEKANWRADTLTVMQQLVVVGSVTEEVMDDDTIRVHRLDNFVWRRDYRGRMLECIVREFWDRKALPAGVSAAAGQNTSLEAKDEDDVEVYAVINLMNSDKDGLFYEVHKETAEGVEVEPKKQFKPEDLRYLFLRWSKTPGEDYGRAKIEEVIGDLRSLDSLSKQSLEQGAMGAKNFTMVRPGATANGLKNRLSRINNGDVVLGDPDSVELKSFASQGGYQITSDQIEKLEARLARAFLLQSGAAQRNAERVTATEIERDIQELEATLGGVFSALSLEMLEKRTSILIEDMKGRGEFPNAAKEDIQTTILTGLEALSRERDVGRGVQAAQILSQFGEEGFKRTKVEILLNSILTGLGFPDAVRDEADVQAADQRQQQAALLEKAAGPAAGALAKGAADGGQP